MSTISQQPITAKRQRLELNGGPDSPLTCSRANDYRERIDRSTSLATALRLGVLGPSQFRQSPFEVMDSVVTDPRLRKEKRDELQGGSVMATGFTVLRPCCVFAEVAAR